MEEDVNHPDICRIKEEKVETEEIITENRINTMNVGIIIGYTLRLRGWTFKRKVSRDWITGFPITSKPVKCQINVRKFKKSKLQKFAGNSANDKSEFEELYTILKKAHESLLD